MTISNTVFTVFSGLGLILSVVPLYQHVKLRFIGTCMFMIWSALGCLVYFVDSIVWSGNVVNRAPVWCDIAIRIQIGLNAALPACSLCVTRRLYCITCAVQGPQTEKRRNMIVDLFITVGIPMLHIAVEYVVASRRFDIVEDYGCSRPIWDEPLSYILLLSWPLVIGVVSACYGALIIRAFIKKRKQFKETISVNTNLTYSSYWRIIGLASVDTCVTIPLVIRVIVTNRLSGISPPGSWAESHRGYSHILQIPRVELDQLDAHSYEVTRWTPVLCTFVFFCFFGFTKEARRSYRLLTSTIAKFGGFTESTSTPDSRAIEQYQSLHFALPPSISQRAVSGGDSDSSSDKFPTAVNEFNLEVQSHSPAKQQTSIRPASLSIDEVPRIPEPVLYPALSRPFVLDLPISLHPDNILDRA